MTVTEFLESLNLTPDTEHRNWACALLHAYSLQTGVVFERHPQSHELLIPEDVRAALSKTWALGNEVGPPSPRLLALWLHHRQAMLTDFGTQPGPKPHGTPSAPPQPRATPVTLHTSRRELL